MLFKDTLKNCVATRRKYALEIADCLFVSERTAYRIINGKRNLTIDEALKLKVLINNKINVLTEVAANL